MLLILTFTAVSNAYTGAADDLASMILAIPMLFITIIVFAWIWELLKTICTKILSLFVSKKNKRTFSNTNKGDFFDKLPYE